MKNDVRAAIAENPVLVLFLGACPAMAASTSVISALGMGAAVLIVMLLSNMLIYALRNAIPKSARLSANILIITAVVSAVQMLMNALLPNVYQMLGVYLAVVAVDLMVYGSAEDAVERSFVKSVVSSLLTGLGFAAAMFVMSAFREILGGGSFAGHGIAFGVDARGVQRVAFFKTYNIPALLQPHGGFVVFAILLAAIQALGGGKTSGKGTACAAAGLSGDTVKEGE